MRISVLNLSWSTNNMRKIYQLSNKIVREFVLLRKYYGLAPAFYTIVWWINFYISTPFRFKISKWALLKKKAWLDKYISTKYASIISRYKNTDNQPYKIDIPNIWVFWGQGENSMPDLVKACYQQLKETNDNVHLITNENLSEYINISSVIITKVTSGKIKWAHFSDLIRMSLLAKYGGLWIDATGWVAEKIPFDKLIERYYYSPNGIAGTGKKDICFWTSLGLNWSGWCLWTNHIESAVFSFVRDMLSATIENEKMTLDYVLIDYFIYYAIRNIPGAKEEFEKIRSLPGNNRNQLALIMDKPYNEKTYQELCKTDFVFKLSFRTPWKAKTSSGKTTFYGHLIKGL